MILTHPIFWNDLPIQFMIRDANASCFANMNFLVLRFESFQSVVIVNTNYYIYMERPQVVSTDVKHFVRRRGLI